MIKFSNSQITDILPDFFSKSPEVQALSFAVSEQIKKLIQTSFKIQFLACIDEANEKILDYLAVQFRTQYYDENFPIETKRELIKSTFLFYKKAGTKWAVEDILRIIFGQGTVTEWFEYGGLPFRFKLDTGMSEFTEDDITLFQDILKKVKNVRSIPESLIFHRDLSSPIKTAVIATSTPKNKIKIDVDYVIEDYIKNLEFNVGIVVTSTPKNEIYIDFAIINGVQNAPTTIDAGNFTDDNSNYQIIDGNG